MKPHVNPRTLRFQYLVYCIARAIAYLPAIRWRREENIFGKFENGGLKS